MQHVVDSALPLMIKAFDTDDDKEAVTAAVLGCGVILSGAGPQACQKHMEPLATAASMVTTLLRNTFFGAVPELCGPWRRRSGLLFPCQHCVPPHGLKSYVAGLSSFPEVFAVCSFGIKCTVAYFIAWR